MAPSDDQLPETLSMTEIIRLQDQLSKALQAAIDIGPDLGRLAERAAALAKAAQTFAEDGAADRVLVETAGGGGYGDARKRTADARAADIAEGKVSASDGPGAAHRADRGGRGRQIGADGTDDRGRKGGSDRRRAGR